MNKYIITVRKDEYGQIEVEANDRKEAQTIALSEGNCKKIQWYNNPDYKVVEVELLAEGIPKHTYAQTQKIYRDLKGMTGNADFISEQAIKNNLGDEAFNALKYYKLIKYCTTIQDKNIYNLAEEI